MTANFVSGRFDRGYYLMTEKQVEDFELLTALRKDENPRVSTTLTAFTLITLVVLAAGETTSSPAGGVQAPAVVASPSTALVPSARIVDAPPPDGSCEDQTWPYIDGHCLKRTDDEPGSKPAEAMPVNVLAASMAQPTPAERQIGSDIPMYTDSLQPKARALIIGSAPLGSPPQVAEPTQTVAVEEIQAESAKPSAMRAERQHGSYAGRVFDTRRPHARHRHAFRLFGFRF
jgi:hypothetical protein